MKKMLIAFLLIFSVASITTAATIYYSETIASVAVVSVTDSQGNYGYGSGFFISIDGLFLTNAHVILDENTGLPAEDIDLCVIDDEFSIPWCFFAAEVLDYDEYLDLALLAPSYYLDENLDPMGDYLTGDDIIALEIPYVDFADFSPSLGEDVTIIGFPAAVGLPTVTLTEGVISGFQLFEEPFQDWIWTMTTDATINPGNSGGPVYNFDERVVGVATAYSTNALGGSYGYITSVDAIYLWFDYLVEAGIMNQAFLDEAFSNDYVDNTGGFDYSDVEVFPDVPLDNKNADAISYLKGTGIVEGYPDGTFGPGNPLNRAELMKILVEGAGYDPDPTDFNNCFPDVGIEWFARYVCFATASGWVEGYPDGTFGPANDVLKVEALKMLLEVFEVYSYENAVPPYTDTPNGEWYTKYVTAAYDLGLLEETSFKYYPSLKITRGGVSENIYRLLLYQIY